MYGIVYLSLILLSNISPLDGAKKLAVEKGKKTIEASHRQLEIAEKKILASLEKVEAKAPTIANYRSPYWFEKFLWFISSGMRRFYIE